MKTMQLSDFYFDLPDDLIARFPQPHRSASRLLQLEGQSGQLTDSQFTDILDLVQAGDLMVFNDTRVIPARIFGHKQTGGQIEILVERILSPHCFLAHIRSSKAPKPGSILSLGEKHQYSATMVRRQDALFELQLPEGIEVLEMLDKIGHMPLPPYIDRPDEAADKERYQTVYNRQPGAVAAPTAGLHFDQALLEQLKQKGVRFAYVTLHVGAGTFQPVRVDKIEEHQMHAEYIEVSEQVISAVQQTKASGGRVIAVGTTSVRSLESIAQRARDLQPDPTQDVSLQQLQAYCGDTQIFIYPGYRYQLIDALITNFHLPESTLIMLVSAFAGYQHTMQAYQHAIAQQYRFFSYGDSMFITPQQNDPDTDLNLGDKHEV